MLIWKERKLNTNSSSACAIKTALTGGSIRALKSSMMKAATRSE